MPQPNRIRRQRWTIFCVLALVYILVYFYRVSLAVIAGDISRELRLTPQELGSLSSILFYVYAFSQIPLGPMIDRIGSRVVISGCGVLTACGGILFSQATSMGGAAAGRVLIGIGTSAVLMATFAIFSHWFTKREFARVSSLMVSVGNLGNFAGTAPFALAVAAFGWRTSFLVVGITQAFATVLVFLVVRDRPPVSTSDTAERGGGEREGMLVAWRQILGNRDFWLLALLAFFWYGNYLALQGLWGGPYLMGVLKLDRVGTGRMLMCTSLGFIAGSLLLDTIAGRIFAASYKRALCAGQLVLLILMGFFLGPAERISVAVLPALFFAVGLAVASGVTIYPIIRSMFPVRLIGTALTSLNFFVLMGAALTQQVMGVIIGRLGRGTTAAASHAFHAAFLFPVVGLAVALSLFLFARDYRER